MRTLAKFVSLLGLLATVLPALFYLRGQLELTATHRWMLAAAVIWFASAPWWMDRNTSDRG
jgi:hypothetical protein